jgi:16S rRNA (guanine966-N2)-methyltransferase
VRIIGGKSKGLSLKAPRGDRVRPTSAKVREALASILSPVLENARMLDLYAGTGAVGIEALSRGAASVDFVENRPASLAVLKDNLRRLKLGERATIHSKDIFRFIKQDAPHLDSFDIIFIDPPYHTDGMKKLLPLLGQGDIISPSGIMIIEHFHKMDLPERIGSCGKTRSARYGDTVLSFYRKS